MQLVILLPFALIRNLAKLSTTALVADVFILAGLVYIFGSEFALIGKNGTAHVELFNPKDFTLLIGFSLKCVVITITKADL
jgi:solute carrier family 36 (proton-coupled amino acid transporter)